MGGLRTSLFSSPVRLTAMSTQGREIRKGSGGETCMVLYGLHPLNLREMPYETKTIVLLVKRAGV